MSNDGMHAGRHAREAAAGHLVDDDGLVAEIAAAAAIGFRDVGAEQAKLACAAPDGVADVTALAGGFVAGWTSVSTKRETVAAKV